MGSVPMFTELPRRPSTATDNQTRCPRNSEFRIPLLFVVLTLEQSIERSALTFAHHE